MPFKKGATPWNKGVSPSSETKERISRTLKVKYANGLDSGFQKGHPCYSYNLKEWIKINSPWNKGIVGDKSHSFGRKFAKERREKIAEKLKGNKNGRNAKGVKRTAEQVARMKPQLMRNLCKMPKRGTKIERLLQWVLSKNGIEFNAQYPLLGKYLADIFIKPNIVVEADGDYWHSSPKAVAKDKKRDDELTASGYIVIRFREKEILSNLNDCWIRLKQSLDQLASINN